MFVHVLLSGDDCHWKPIPPEDVKPDAVSVKVVAVEPVVGLTPAVPAVGVPEQTDAEVPVTFAQTAEDNPPPVTQTVPE